MLSYYVIWYEKFRKVMQRTEKVALTYNHNYLYKVSLLFTYMEYKTVAVYFTISGFIKILDVSVSMSLMILQSQLVVYTWLIEQVHVSYIEECNNIYS